MNKDFFFIPLVLIFWCWVMWFIVTMIRRSKTAKLQAELRNRLLDKLGSSQELFAYLQTDAGKQFLESLPAEQKTPFGRIVGALEASVVLIAFGAALLLLRWNVAGADQGFLVFGTLIMSLGIGFALAAMISYFFSKSAGLLGGTIKRR